MARSICGRCKKLATLTPGGLCLCCTWELVSAGTCPHCWGHGVLDAHDGNPEAWKVCPRCQKTGKVPPEPCTCYVCEGEGTPDGVVGCELCNATGLLSPEQPKVVR